jgi:hypothetical protein
VPPPLLTFLATLRSSRRSRTGPCWSTGHSLQCGAGAAYVFADLGYRGTGYFIPRRKPVGGQLTGQQRDYAARISAIRAPIERAVANLNAWRILHTDYRRPLHTYHDALHAALGLHCFTTRQRSA